MTMDPDLCCCDDTFQQQIATEGCPGDPCSAVPKEWWFQISGVDNSSGSACWGCLNECVILSFVDCVNGWIGYRCPVDCEQFADDGIPDQTELISLKLIPPGSTFGTCVSPGPYTAYTAVLSFGAPGVFCVPYDPTNCFAPLVFPVVTPIGGFNSGPVTITLRPGRGPCPPYSTDWNICSSCPTLGLGYSVIPQQLHASIVNQTGTCVCYTGTRVIDAGLTFGLGKGQYWYSDPNESFSFCGVDSGNDSVIVFWCTGMTADFKPTFNMLLTKKMPSPGVRSYEMLSASCNPFEVVFRVHANDPVGSCVGTVDVVIQP
jgi:hypothetical protein